MISHSSPTIKKDDIECVERFLKSEKILSGEAGCLFSAELKKFFNAKKVILTPSGTAAIAQALNLLNVKKEDNVIIPAYVCSSVAKGVLISGAKPLAVDINRDDYNISYEDTIKKISGKTKAIILPSVFGNPIRNIKDFLETGVAVIEDVAQSIGAEFQKKRLGAFGDMSVCSFYATKVITTGEGGALVINNGELIRKAGKKEKIFEMTTFQSAIGLSQLRKIDKLIKKRKHIARQYIKGLDGLSNIKISKPDNSIYYRFIIEAEEKPDKIIKDLRVLGIKAERFTDITANFLKLNINEYLIKCLKKILKK